MHLNSYLPFRPSSIEKITTNSASIGINAQNCSVKISIPGYQETNDIPLVTINYNKNGLNFKYWICEKRSKITGSYRNSHLKFDLYPNYQFKAGAFIGGDEDDAQLGVSVRPSEKLVCFSSKFALDGFNQKRLLQLGVTTKYDAINQKFSGIIKPIISYQFATLGAFIHFSYNYKQFEPNVFTQIRYNPVLLSLSYQPFKHALLASSVINYKELQIKLSAEGTDNMVNAAACSLKFRDYSLNINTDKTIVASVSKMINPKVQFDFSVGTNTLKDIPIFAYSVTLTP